MNANDKLMLKDFQDESKKLISQLIDILNLCEGDYKQVQGLEQYGQTVDRIMGGAKSLVVALVQQHPLVVQIGDYAAVCKAVGYKASQIRDNEIFYEICVALLLDATEVLGALVNHLFDGDRRAAKTFFSPTFIDRLKWVSEKFGSELRSSVQPKSGSSQKMDQADIDELLKKLGLD